MMNSAQYVIGAGDEAAAATSMSGFEDGGRFRVEIPSSESPDAVLRVVTAAKDLDVPVHRISQGSGVFMLSTAELDDLVSIGAEHNVEICLFARPTAAWDIGGLASSDGGALVAGACRGDSGLIAAMRDIERAAIRGIRSVLISDIGLLAVAAQARQFGDIPPSMVFKMSASFPATNAATLQVLSSLGADTVNVAGDATISQLAGMRNQSDLPFDIYVESPGHLGGFVRTWEVAELVRVASPVYLKFGIRNAPDLYPSGLHHAAVARDLAEERVRRAMIALEALRAQGAYAPSPIPGSDCGIPAVPHT
ncbi:U32 family peptidase [Kribbella solani]|uniref:U32 family peptidase n=1 Tax=Kribbella solani TaxID=236067 RepID=UPI0029BB2E31|nr:U32 family peptidase [Kribbella solani]MDX3006554.1 U32 family peptidase [Kribbella solani]